jgi:putative tricarboxylic transport membrane protein
MTKKGMAGQALFIAAIGSFMAGTLGAIGISFLGIGFAKYALRFGPSEYFALLFFSLTALISLSEGSIAKGLGAGVIGLILASVGTDPMPGQDDSPSAQSVTRGLLFLFGGLSDREITVCQ